MNFYGQFHCSGPYQRNFTVCSMSCKPKWRMILSLSLSARRTPHWAHIGDVSLNCSPEHDGKHELNLLLGQVGLNLFFFNKAIRLQRITLLQYRLCSLWRETEEWVTFSVLRRFLDLHDGVVNSYMCRKQGDAVLVTCLDSKSVPQRRSEREEPAELAPPFQLKPCCSPRNSNEVFLCVYVDAGTANSRPGNAFFRVKL